MQASPAFKLVQLANGARSVHSLAHRETFHPVIGPLAEARALYVEQLRLGQRIAQHQGEFVVWDIGLGAAANAIAVFQATRQIAGPLRVISFDQTLEPLRFALLHRTELGYFDGYEEPATELARTTADRVAFTNGLQPAQWQFVLGDFPALLGKPEANALPKPDAILFDAYSPAKNPAMWTQRLFVNLFALLAPDRPCALATYSRSTMLRVTLLLAGFFVGQGHPTGEKEETTIAANNRALLEDPLDKRWLRRARHSTSAEPLREDHYRQAPLSAESWERLLAHPQFDARAAAWDLTSPTINQ